jgi:hypothetical protein
MKTLKLSTIDKILDNMSKMPLITVWNDKNGSIGKFRIKLYIQYNDAKYSLILNCQFIVEVENLEANSSEIKYRGDSKNDALTNFNALLILYGLSLSESLRDEML